MLENILTGDGAAATVVDTFAGAAWVLIADHALSCLLIAVATTS